MDAVPTLSSRGRQSPGFPGVTSLPPVHRVTLTFDKMTLMMRNAQQAAVVICNRGHVHASHTLVRRVFIEETPGSVFLVWAPCCGGGGGGTYCDGPPVAQLTDGVGQDEGGEPEDGQQLCEETGGGAE